MIRWNSPSLTYKVSPECSAASCEGVHDPRLSPLLSSQLCHGDLAMPNLELPAVVDGDPSVPMMMVPKGGLQTRHVAVFAFAMTCAGPFGVESCVQAFGVAWSFLGFIFTCVFYILPQIMMTAQLSMTLPLSNGGVVSWVSRSLGRRAAAIVALDMLAYQFVDLATYPTLVVGYAQALDYDLMDGVPFACAFVMLAVGLLCNILHVEFASNLYACMLIAILLPFVVGICVSIPSWRTAFAVLQGAQPATLQKTQPELKDLNLFLSTMMWLNTGWDSMGNLASEVATPAAMARGLAMAASWCPLVYILCTFGALAAGPGDWNEGYLAVAYGKLWWPLRTWIVVVAGISNFLLYVSELTCVAHLIQSMAEGSASDGNFVSTLFAKQLSTGAPVVALALVTLVEVFLISATSFDWLIQLSTLLHVFVFWFSLAAFAWHSFVEVPQGKRLWVVPGGWFGAAVVFGLTFIVLALLSFTSLANVEMVFVALLWHFVYCLYLFRSSWCSALRRASAQEG
eukprot:TRINITY_DN12161_c0_g1_i3.p1 TRINITY_DN12161_c0_g1~~TRINITY_DN12161_c0_g1_i3.p1  ORF type:complete len:512 (+),score=50.42 TRINITY_DN12161_c0_g1_i3:75-1610(+)